MSEVLAGSLLGFIIGCLVMFTIQMRRRIGWLTKQLKLKQLGKEGIAELKKSLKEIE
jgi:membrane-associated phospholipid phosphatase